MSKFFSREYWREIVAIISALTAIGIVTFDPAILDVLPEQIELVFLAALAVIDTVGRFVSSREA